MYMKGINNLQPRNLNFFSFFFVQVKKKSLQFDWFTKNRNGQAFMWICSLLRADESLK